MNCAACGREMLWYVDTLLCSICDREVIEELSYDYNEKKGRNK